MCTPFFGLCSLSPSLLHREPLVLLLFSLPRKLHVVHCARLLTFSPLAVVSQEAADAAIQQVDGMEVGGRSVNVMAYKNRQTRTGANEWNNAYVKNFPIEVRSCCACGGRACTLTRVGFVRAVDGV